MVAHSRHLSTRAAETTSLCLQSWQKIEDAEWRPQTYLELEGLPCILIFSGMDPHGESLPRCVEGTWLGCRGLHGQNPGWVCDRLLQGQCHAPWVWVVMVSRVPRPPLGSLGAGGLQLG